MKARLLTSALLAIIALGFIWMSVASATTPTELDRVDEITIVQTKGTVQPFQVLLAVKAIYGNGVKPRVTKEATPLWVDRYNVRFQQGGGLKRVQVNGSHEHSVRATLKDGTVLLLNIKGMGGCRDVALNLSFRPKVHKASCVDQT